MASSQVAVPSSVQQDRSSARHAVIVIAVLGSLKLLLHLLFNGRYNFFRDELYYIECSKHLAWGYADQPPLIALSVRISRILFGNSLLGLRLFAALSMIGVLA